jgi:hypothetical protein
VLRVSASLTSILGRDTPSCVAQINIAINALSVEISRPAEIELDLLGQQQCAAHHLALIPPAVHGRESYPPPSDPRSTKP